MSKVLAKGQSCMKCVRDAAEKGPSHLPPARFRVTIKAKINEREETEMLKLVLGASGSGKTTLLYARIRARAEAGKRSILLVPEQFTSSTEARIYRELGDALSGMVESYSFTSLAEHILAALGGAFALGAVHIQRQTDQNHLGFDLLRHLAYPGGYLVAGF